MSIISSKCWFTRYLVFLPKSTRCYWNTHVEKTIEFFSSPINLRCFQVNLNSYRWSLFVNNLEQSKWSVKERRKEERKMRIVQETRFNSENTRINKTVHLLLGAMIMPLERRTEGGGGQLEWGVRPRTSGVKSSGCNSCLSAEAKEGGWFDFFSSPWISGINHFSSLTDGSINFPFFAPRNFQPLRFYSPFFIKSTNILEKLS